MLRSPLHPCRMLQIGVFSLSKMDKCRRLQLLRGWELSRLRTRCSRGSSSSLRRWKFLRKRSSKKSLLNLAFHGLLGFPNRMGIGQRSQAIRKMIHSEE